MPFAASSARGVALLIALAATLVLGHFNDPRLSAFTVRSTDKGKQSVRLELENDSSLCSFSYVTNPAALEQPVVKNTERKADLNAIINALAGSCLRRATNYWHYELCFKGLVRVATARIACLPVSLKHSFVACAQFKQYHDAETFSLGAPVRALPAAGVSARLSIVCPSRVSCCARAGRTGKVEDGTTFVYADGDMCDGVQPAIPRKSTVEFHCDENKQVRCDSARLLDRRVPRRAQDPRTFL
jgi:hypothetical protein